MTAVEAYKKWLKRNPQELLEQLPFGYLVTQPDGVIIASNQTINEWLGLHKEQLEFQQKFIDLLTVGGKMYLQTHQVPLLQLQGFVEELSYVIKTSNNVRIPVLVSAFQENDSTGKLLFTRIFLVNITDRKKYEKELVLSKQKAEAAVEAKANFLSTISHEIRTPMHAIMGTTDLLLRNEILPDQSELLNVLRFSAKNLLVLINNVLDFSKMEAGGLNLLAKPFNINELTKSLIFSLQSQVAEKSVVLDLQMASDVPIFLEGDQFKIGQILTNLLGNAIKFTSEGQVVLKVKAIGNDGRLATLKFTVTDTGIGIKQDRLETIFNEFTQADFDIGTNYGGTGLGLAIARRLVELHGSQLQVASEYGVGSTFEFALELPIAKASEVISKETLSTKQGKSLTGIKVLLVEDNQTNIFIAGTYFKRWKLDYDIAKNGQEAVDMVQQQHYDLVFMDLKMPVLNGYDATKQIRNLAGEQYKKLPIIALSASADLANNVNLDTLGISGFILKPFDPDELFLVINRYRDHSISAAPIVINKATQAEVNAAQIKLIYEYFDHDVEDVKSFVEIVLLDWKDIRADITQSIAARDLQLYRDATHKMLSITRMLKADKLQQSITELRTEFVNTDKQLFNEKAANCLVEFDYVVSLLQQTQHPA